MLVFIMALLKYFKKSSVLPNPDGQQTKKSRPAYSGQRCDRLSNSWVWHLSLARTKTKIAEIAVAKIVRHKKKQPTVYSTIQ